MDYVPEGRPNISVSATLRVVRNSRLCRTSSGCRRSSRRRWWSSGGGRRRSSGTRYGITDLAPAIAIDDKVHTAVWLTLATRVVSISSGVACLKEWAREFGTAIVCVDVVEGFGLNQWGEIRTFIITGNNVLFTKVHPGTESHMALQSGHGKKTLVSSEIKIEETTRTINSFGKSERHKVISLNSRCDIAENLDIPVGRDGSFCDCDCSSRGRGSRDGFCGSCRFWSRTRLGLWAVKCVWVVIKETTHRLAEEF